MSSSEPGSGDAQARLAALGMMDDFRASPHRTANAGPEQKGGDDPRQATPRSAAGSGAAAGKKTEPTPVTYPHINDFLYYLSAECMLARNTILAYERDLRRLAEFLLRGGFTRPESVGSDEIVDFVASLCEDGLAPASRARMLVAVRMFYRFLVSENIASADPCLAVDQPKLTRYLPHELGPEEVEALLRAEDGHDPLSVRNRAILEVFYATGARVSEVCGLRVLDVDLAQQRLRILGKGSKMRLCPLGQASREAISYYADLRGLYDKGRGCPFFFLSKSGKGLERVAVFRVVKAAALKAGIGRNVYPHLLRHSFATHMLRGGAHLRAVQELLGHASPNTTEIYTHLTDRQKYEEFYEYHPRGRDAEEQARRDAAARSKDA